MYAYLDGQKIAKKLSRQISKETSSRTRLIGDYNGMSTSVFIEALSVGVIESKLGDLGLACASIATGSRRQILDAYLLLHRSEEELKMLHQEFNNYLLNYYKKINTVITVAIAKFSNYDDKLSNGAVAMLTKLRHS